MTVRELLGRVDSRELTEWVAFHNLHPWGEERADLRAGIVASTVANCHSTKGTFKPSDFMPRLDRRAKPEQTPQDHKDIAQRINAMFGGTVRN